MPLRGVLAHLSRGLLWVSLFSLGAYTTGGSAQATVAQALALDDLVHEADDVVVADVVSSRAAWDARHETIVTTVELAVVESWKGGSLPNQHITFQQPGGTVDDVTMTVSGLSSFDAGERTLLFLRDVGKTRAAKNAPSPTTATRSLTVVGLAQGKRHLEAVPADPATKGSPKRWMVHPPSLAGLATVPRNGTGRPSVTSSALSSPSSSAPATISIDEMRAKVFALLKNESK